MPTSWRWPERMATRILDERSLWDAGQRLMQTAAPESWALIVATAPLSDANRETLEQCREAAERAKKAVRCTINVKPAGQRSEEHTSELQSLMRISYAVFCLKKQNKKNEKKIQHRN